ncbi:MAG: hypothetical protein JWQ07_133 [Ramlibacter sp.]|nr:hypothetical protein [Ramlibacter sp.]
MRNRREVSDFGKKIDLILSSDKTQYRQQSDFSKALKGVQPDYFSRLKGGSRVLSEGVFNQIVELCQGAGVAKADWHGSLEAFGEKLGFTRKQIDDITGAVAPRGIDFGSRSKDGGNIDSVFQVIGGYWESFYYSVSTFDEARISHDLIVIEEPDEGGFMPCKVIDGSFVYAGHCFPIHGSFVYFMLEKQQLLDEIIVYLMNRPERTTNPVLDGIILCTSGGVHDKVAVPCAARVAFRYLGKTLAEVKQALPHIKAKRGQTLTELLTEQIPGYIDPVTIGPENKRYWEVKQLIDNTIAPDQIPFAMRMERHRKLPIQANLAEAARKVVG